MFAEVFPHHKDKIVKVFQEASPLVAADGDGLSDCRRLREAHLGIAIAGAGIAARATTDVVLLKPGLPIAAIATARQALQNFSSVTVYRLSLAFHQQVFLVCWTALFVSLPRIEIIVLLAALPDVLCFFWIYRP